MVRVRPGTPIQLHHRGLEPEEAQRLAAELWREQPRRRRRLRLIVDIASPRRRYGRLAEFLAPGRSTPPRRTRYSTCTPSTPPPPSTSSACCSTPSAATPPPAPCSRSPSPCRGSTTSVDLVQVLADTVPDVTECAQSTVHLWDRELGQLVPRARTAGPEPEHAFMGPIIPVTGGRPARRRRVGPGPGHDRTPTAGRARAPSARLSAPRRRLTSRRHAGPTPRSWSSTSRPTTRSSGTCWNGSGIAASVVAPLFANGEFLGVVAANFGSDTPTAAIHDPDLHERLSGLADQAATSLQNLELLEKVSHMAWHDSLTGLPNRRLFEDRVETGAGAVPPGRRAGLHVLRRPRPLQDGQRHARAHAPATTSSAR